MTTRPSRKIVRSRVISVREVRENIFVLRFHDPGLATTILPGQFVNIKVSQGDIPLLRRPFSVYRVEDGDVEIVFKAVGTGTKILSTKGKGEEIDVLGPLGKPYNVEDDYETAILVGGGLGVAPLPILTDVLKGRSRRLSAFLGARTRNELVTDHLENLTVSTDDGSEGFHGTVIDLVAETLRRTLPPMPKIFACGPNIMLQNVASLAASLGIPAEVSLECAMACGFGICQGCPVETNHEVNGREKKYFLVCKDGPVFDTSQVRIG